MQRRRQFLFRERLATTTGSNLFSKRAQVWYRLER
jgi:hypothetical protein